MEAYPRRVPSGWDCRASRRARWMPAVRDADLVGTMDVVLADVPCSGLGVIRKKPEIRFKDPAALSQLPAIQRDILEGLAPCVRPGGVLVYSTCTVLARENEDVVRDFLRMHPDFAPEVFSLPLPAADTAGGNVYLLAAGT